MNLTCFWKKIKVKKIYTSNGFFEISGILL